MLDGEVPIRNFHRVHEGIMRGGQPTHLGYEWLAANGVRTVVSLRFGRRIIEAERHAVESVGMEFVSIALNYWTLPDQKTIEYFFALVDDSAKRPIYIHCFHGSDRTGLLMAIHRMARDGWTVQEAYNEMKACGFHRFRIRHFKWVLWRWAAEEHRRGVVPATPAALVSEPYSGASNG